MKEDSYKAMHAFYRVGKAGMTVRQWEDKGIHSALISTMEAMGYVKTKKGITRITPKGVKALAAATD